MRVASNTRPTAGSLGVGHLYHYQPFIREYLLDILRSTRVHCSDPANLNDPWDCKPSFAESQADDPEFVERFIALTLPVADNPEAAAYEAAIRHDADFRRRQITALSRNLTALVPLRWGIYCMTPIADSTLMWSHYGDKHRGICLEFDARFAPFKAAQQVEYLKEYPAFSPVDIERDALRLLFIKSNDWAYEQEFRVMGLTDKVERAIQSHPLIMDGPYLRIPSASLKAVIVGAEGDYDAVQQTVRESCANVELKRIVRSSREYRLVIENEGR